MQQCIGTLLGGCCGDILGSKTEGMQREDIIRKYGKLIETMPEIKKYTDDTEMTIALSQHLTENGGNVDMVRVHEKYASMMTNRGYSDKTRFILTEIREGRMYNLPKGDSDHNGSIMRIAPLGLIQFKSDQILMQVIDNALFYTHGTNAAKACCFLHCKLIGALVTNRFSQKAKLFSYLHTISSELSSFYPDLFPKLNIVKFCLLWNKSEINITYELTGNANTFQIKAVDCLCCAYYIFFKYDDPLIGIKTAAAIGGDTDTITKLVGELYGAMHGPNWIPEEWRGMEDEILLINLGTKLYSYNNIHI